MKYCYSLVEHGVTLATRPFGDKLREDLIKEAGGEQVVELDFSGVLSTSHSFADEFVARLAEEADKGKVDFELTVSGASTDVERVLRRALERRSIELPIAA